MVPELKYVNHEIEVCIFGKSIEKIITTQDPKKQREEEKEFLSSFFQIPRERIFLLDQVHGADCIRITQYDISPNENQILYHKADALITDMENVILCIRTADCLPIFFHTNPTKEKKIIGVMHVGWRGLHRGIIQNTLGIFHHTIEKILFEHKIQKKEYQNYIDYPISIFPGIYIPEKIYEVGKEVADLFPIVENRNQHYYLDLWKNSFYVLKNLSIWNRISFQDPFYYLVNSKEETFKNFFSHRRGDSLRNLNIIWIKKNKTQTT